MKFIATITVIALSGAAICSQDFGGHVNTDFVRPQSNSSSLPSVSTQQPLEKSQIFQAATNSQHNVTNYHVQRPSSFYTSSKIDIPKSLFTHLSSKPPLFPSTTPRPLRSAFRTGKDLAGKGIAGNGISTAKAPATSITLHLVSPTAGVSGPPGSSVQSSEAERFGEVHPGRFPSGAGGFGGGFPSEGGGYEGVRPSVPPQAVTPSYPSSGYFYGTSFIPPSTTPRPLYLNTYLPPRSNTQQPHEKPFQVVTNSLRNDITGYTTQRPLSLYIPPNIGYSASKQPSTPFSTLRPSQQLSSMYVPQGFRGSTTYNPRPSQPSYFNTDLTAFPPLNSPKSSSLYSPQLPLFASTSPRTLSTESMNGTSKSSGRGGSTYPSLSGFTSMPEYSIFRRPFSPFTTPGKIGAGVGFNVSTITEGPRIPEIRTGVSTTGIGETTQSYDDLNHPPHIHSLDVECSKTMMTINIEFNRAFNGVIYSKGYFINPECTYVKQNSGSTRYSFTVNLNSCGTQFINDFEGAAGQAYLENVLVLQNEPGIQEVWDTIRRVRCLWEGNINKTLMVNLSVNMLNQEIVTFSGDTATAKLDIQIGKGPFAPAADRLVKIGETMTLVVSVEGDPGFDLQVRDCLARDETSTNMLQLTDERGCILKPKLFGAFQKTNSTGNTGASIIAYAFFQAFKFPDIMDLFIECNIELCKTNCEPCPKSNQVRYISNQKIITFGNNTTGKLDIQIGKGPFAPAANRFVNIGETMTLVVSVKTVKTDPDFDLEVRDCLARSKASTNMLQLTDERGCILDPKLFGAFQKTNNTGNTNASIIAYAFFRAFKLPDVTDLFIECNVELCNTNCKPCPEANQQIEPGRRRRSVTYASPLNNSTNSIPLSDTVRVGRRFKVIMLNDLTSASSQILDSMETVE